MPTPISILDQSDPTLLLSLRQVQTAYAVQDDDGADFKVSQAIAMALVRLVLIRNRSAQRVLVLVDQAQPNAQALAAASCLQAFCEVIVWKVPDTDTGWMPELTPTGLIVDAMSSCTGPLQSEKALKKVVQWVHDLQQQYPAVPLLALQVPAGLDADSGEIHSMGGLCAHDTLCWLAPSPGLWTNQGRDAVGNVWLLPDPERLQSLGLAPMAALTAQPCLNLLRRARNHGSHPKHATHKGGLGDVWVLGGALGMTGAACLAAQSALRAGAGRVYLAPLESSHETHHAIALNAEIMLRTPEQCLNNQAAENTVWVVGCGGGSVIQEYMGAVLHDTPCLVLDADALNAVARDTALQQLLLQRSAQGLHTVLTPHPLEAARLLDISVAQLQKNRLAYAQQLAQRYQSTIVLKGSGSIVASPHALAAINPTGNARLSTAGSGDVLAGWIGGAWAQLGTAVDVHEIVKACVYLHGAAVDEVEPRNLPNPVRAGDLPGLMAEFLVKCGY
jgi:hydroxyethylthiazole kinase-like uncharacterized protein yjeF